MFTDLPLELIGEIACKSRLAYHPLVLAYPAFARSLTLGNRLDFAEKFGYDCKVKKSVDTSGILWYVNGTLHRTDGPAIETASGEKHWCFDGKRHRVDGPAIERADGYKVWYLNDKRHRLCGPAIDCADGRKEWYTNGKLHRTDGPAVEHADGYKAWYKDDKLHRTDGPAIEWPDGFKRWCINGIGMSEEEFWETILGFTLIFCAKTEDLAQSAYDVRRLTSRDCVRNCWQKSFGLSPVSPRLPCVRPQLDTRRSTGFCREIRV